MALLGIALPIVSMSEAQAFVRIETGEEEAVLAGLVRTASGLCEAFLDQVVVARPFEVDVPASRAWERLALNPVRAIDGVAGISAEGILTPLAPLAYAVDIDSSGDGWLRVMDAGDAARVRVSGVAGLAETPNEVPEPIRHGVLRLTAHLFASRDGPGGEAPAAVTALWRPYRRMRIA